MDIVLHLAAVQGHDMVQRDCCQKRPFVAAGAALHGLLVRWPGIRLSTTCVNHMLL